MTTHRPQRTCIGCRLVTDQQVLLRWIEDPQDPSRILPDPKRRGTGRGAWLHPDPECARLAVRRGGFARAFRSSRIRVELDELLAALNKALPNASCPPEHLQT
ncbi:MAG: YlxR family protein [Galactobacter sp.]